MNLMVKLMALSVMARKNGGSRPKGSFQKPGQCLRGGLGVDFGVLDAGAHVDDQELVLEAFPALNGRKLLPAYLNAVSARRNRGADFFFSSDASVPRAGGCAGRFPSSPPGGPL